MINFYKIITLLKACQLRFRIHQTIPFVKRIRCSKIKFELHFANLFKKLLSCTVNNLAYCFETLPGRTHLYIFTDRVECRLKRIRFFLVARSVSGKNYPPFLSIPLNRFVVAVKKPFVLLQRYGVGYYYAPTS